MHVVCVFPIHVKALNVEFFHGVSASEENSHCIFELKFSGTAISCCYP